MGHTEKPLSDTDNLPDGEKWFARNLQSLIGGQIAIVNSGKREKIDRESIRDWIDRHCEKNILSENTRLKEELEALRGRKTSLIDAMERIKELLERYAEGNQERGEDLTLTEMWDTVEAELMNHTFDAPPSTTI